ncbi:MAG TPA: hypothetical protein VF506_07365, partial [Streptosporangiaceae bacterium]
MSQAGEEIGRSSSTKEIAVYDDAAERDYAWADLRSTVDWLRNNRVLVAAILLIVVELVWKAQFLSHMYFRQDDFHDLDIAAESPFNWRYVTYIGAGHLIIGLRVVAWLMVQTSLYNWGLAAAISLAFVAAANLAALRLLRMLFGDRPAILIPLLIYAICPLTMPDLGEWSSALESVPLQLALLMAVHAHICYVRTRRLRHLAAAASWVVVGLIFFEKGLVVPLLLVGLTAGFLIVPRGFWLADVMRTLVRYWRAWLIYAALMVAYLVVLAQSLHTSTTHPRAPASATAVATFAQGILKDSLVPGALGGPWQWLAVPGGSYAFAAPPFALVWIGLLVAFVVMAISIWRRPIAWRAWVLVIGWVALADMLPVIISRIGSFSADVLGTETRYVADAVPVLAISVGLAFWPLAADQARRPKAGGAHGHRARSAPLSLEVAAGLVAVIVFGSIWSVQAYKNVTTGKATAAYIANASAAIKQAPRGTIVADSAVSGDMVEGLFGVYALQSRVIGDIAPGKLRWLQHPKGTIDGLHVFGPDGKLYQAKVYGVASEPLPLGQKCLPSKNGRTVVRFQSPSPNYTVILRLGYLWFSSSPGYVSVSYPGGTQQVAVKHGLHSAYVHITGSVSQVTVRTLGGGAVCIGDAEAGKLRAD